MKKASSPINTGASCYQLNSTLAINPLAATASPSDALSQATQAINALQQSNQGFHLRQYASATRQVFICTCTVSSMLTP